MGHQAQCYSRGNVLQMTSCSDISERISPVANKHCLTKKTKKKKERKKCWSCGSYAVENSPHAFKVDIETSAVSVWEDSVVHRRQKHFKPQYLYTVFHICDILRFNTFHMNKSSERNANRWKMAKL